MNRRATYYRLQAARYRALAFYHDACARFWHGVVVVLTWVKNRQEGADHE